MRKQFQALKKKLAVKAKQLYSKSHLATINRLYSKTQLFQN